MHPDLDIARAGGLSYAYQPIVDIAGRAPCAYEALLRGARGEPAGVVLGPLSDADIEAIDAHARPRAIALAAKLGLTTRLHLNFQPRSLTSSSAVIDDALRVAARHGFSKEQIVLEVTETQIIDDQRRFAEGVESIDEYY